MLAPAQVFERTGYDLPARNIVCRIRNTSAVTYITEFLEKYSVSHDAGKPQNSESFDESGRKPSEIVFLPNHVDRKDQANARLEDFLDCCVRGKSNDWTCKKAAAKGDVYLF